MTKREFFKELRTLRGQFRVKNDGEIRCSRGDCPIIAVARKLKVAQGRRSLSGRAFYENHLYYQAANVMGLREKFATEIADAADSNFAEYRMELLEVLGLR